MITICYHKSNISSLLPAQKKALPLIIIAAYMRVTIVGRMFYYPLVLHMRSM